MQSSWGQYRAILKRLRPDLVLTYTIKPNIYGGLACRVLHIPYAVNITGLGSAIENGGWLKRFVLTLYKPVLAGGKGRVFRKRRKPRYPCRRRRCAAGARCCAPWRGRQSGGLPLPALPAGGGRCASSLSGASCTKGRGRAVCRRKADEADVWRRCEFHIVGSFEEGYKPLMDELEQTGVVKYHGYQSDMKHFLRHGRLCRAAVVSRGDVQRAAGGCRLRPSAHHERYPPAAARRSSPV